MCFLVEGFVFLSIPVCSDPTLFSVYLLFYITDPNHKTRYPRNGVGYEPLGIERVHGFLGRPLGFGLIFSRFVKGCMPKHVLQAFH